MHVGRLIPAEVFAFTCSPHVLKNPFDRHPWASYHIVALSDDESAISVAIFHLFKRLLVFFAIGVHNFFPRVFFNVADNPFLTATIARRYVAPRVDEEEIGERPASGTISGFVATKAAVNGAVEVSAAVVFQSVW